MDRIYGPSRLKCEENTCLRKGFLTQMLCLFSRSSNENELNWWQTKTLTKPDTEEIQWLWSHRPRRLPGACSDGSGGERKGLEFHTQPSSSGTRRWNSQMKGRSSFEWRWWTSPQFVPVMFPPLGGTPHLQALSSETDGRAGFSGGPTKQGPAVAINTLKPNLHRRSN